MKRISSNLEKFKAEKAERSHNPRWKARKIHLAELQPSSHDWFEAYETVVAENLLCDTSVTNASSTSADHSTGIISNVQSTRAFARVIAERD